MIDFFDKGASMTKRVTGIAHLKGAPVVNPRPNRRITCVGRFLDEEDESTSVLLEVADTPEKRRVGMMGRADLPSICGMLFTGLSDGGYFWMKDCLIPLDVVFISRNGYITKTYSMPVDKSGSRHYAYDADDVSAIELEYGFIRKWQIVPGMRVEIRTLGKEGKHD